MDLQLKDKVALVTAASSGLGFSAAVQLIKEGCKVAVCSRSQEHLKQAYATQNKDQIALFEADLNDQQSIDNLVNNVISHYGRLDILITNIGGPPLTDFNHAKETMWEEAHRSLLMSCVHLINASLPYLRKSKAASILTITSVTTKQFMPGFLLSAVYRPAVIGLTNSLAKELGRDHIRVNSILPGYTMTERLNEAFEHKAKMGQCAVKDIVAKVTNDIPLGRIANPEEFGKTAAFLVSPAASYITGVMLPVDGGFCESVY